MSDRFFRTADAELYEHIRLTLDAAWGLPSSEGVVTCIAPESVAPRDSEGHILLAVRAEFCEYTVAVDLLPQLLASGDIEEITRDEYQPVGPTPI